MTEQLSFNEKNWYYRRQRSCKKFCHRQHDNRQFCDSQCSSRQFCHRQYSSRKYSDRQHSHTASKEEARSVVKLRGQQEWIR